MCPNSPDRHARTCYGHPRDLSVENLRWIPAMNAGMTKKGIRAGRGCRATVACERVAAGDGAEFRFAGLGRFRGGLRLKERLGRDTVGLVALMIGIGFNIGIIAFGINVFALVAAARRDGQAPRECALRCRPWTTNPSPSADYRNRRNRPDRIGLRTDRRHRWRRFSADRISRHGSARWRSVPSPRGARRPSISCSRTAICRIARAARVKARAEHAQFLRRSFGGL